MGAVVLVQPVAGLQASMVQAFPSLHVGGAPGVQMLPWHVSVPLHALVSPQVAPFGRGALVQPKIASQLSVVQALPSLQASGVPEAQTPPWQASTPLHTLPSLQEVPFRSGTLAHPDSGSQLSVVQALASLQLRGGPAVQTPP
jgi:hypothetical protein